MTPRPLHAAAALVLALALSACYTSRPVVDRTSKPPDQQGTVSGLVTTEANTPVPGRIVRAVAIEGPGGPYEVTTNQTGGYTIKVPPGRYRIEVELRAGERLAEEPGETNVNESDLDPSRNFVITRTP